MVPRMVASIRRMTEPSEAADAIIRSFEHHHRKIYHCEQKDLPKRRKVAGGKPDCDAEGICLCGLDGDIAHRNISRLGGCVKTLVKGLHDAFCRVQLVMQLCGFISVVGADADETSADLSQFWGICRSQLSP